MASGGHEFYNDDEDGFFDAIENLHMTMFVPSSEVNS
jgi:hypothetical protein